LQVGKVGSVLFIASVCHLMMSRSDLSSAQYADIVDCCSVNTGFTFPYACIFLKFSMTLNLTNTQY